VKQHALAWQTRRPHGGLIPIAMTWRDRCPSSPVSSFVPSEILATMSLSLPARGDANRIRDCS